MGGSPCQSPLVEREVLEDVTHEQYILVQVKLADILTRCEVED
jgi:hypothetical protein